MNQEQLKPHISIVLPHYSPNSQSNKEIQYTLRCVNSIKESNYPNFTIIIIDAGSVNPLRITSDDGQVVYQHYPDNLGCAGSFNIGVQNALNRESKYILLVNNDTVIGSTTISDLVTFAELNPTVGTVGPKVLSIKNGLKTNLIQTIGGKFIGGNYAHWQTDRGQFELPQAVDFVAGAAMLVRASLVQRLGLFDPQYFIWYEELDFGIKIKKAGYKAYYYPTNVWHEGAQSLVDRYSPKLGYYTTRNLLYTMRKHEFVWKLLLLPRFISVEAKTIAGSIFLKRNPQTLIAIARGFYNGITDKL